MSAPAACTAKQMQAALLLTWALGFLGVSQRQVIAMLKELRSFPGGHNINLSPVWVWPSRPF